MIVAEVPTPFGEPVEEIPLPTSPLIAVVAQIRFPPIASIAREDFIGPFQELIRTDFPVLRQEQEMGMLLTPSGVKSAAESATVWRFLDRARNPEWKLSLASSFVALDTSNYTSRGDFVRRLVGVLNALEQTVRPSTCDRIGLRYVDRVELGPEDVDLSELFRAEVLGVATTDPGTGAELVHSISDSEFRLADATLHGRWGKIPANAQLDPLHGDSVDVPSWILDLDMYSTNLAEFDVDALAATAEVFAERIYRFFRWAVRPSLLRRYGGAL